MSCKRSSLGALDSPSSPKKAKQDDDKPESKKISDTLGLSDDDDDLLLETPVRAHSSVTRQRISQQKEASDEKLKLFQSVLRSRDKSVKELAKIEKQREKCSSVIKDLESRKKEYEEEHDRLKALESLEAKNTDPVVKDSLLAEPHLFCLPTDFSAFGNYKRINAAFSKPTLFSLAREHFEQALADLRPKTSLSKLETNFLLDLAAFHPHVSRTAFQILRVHLDKPPHSKHLLDVSLSSFGSRFQKHGAPIRKHFQMLDVTKKQQKPPSEAPGYEFQNRSYLLILFDMFLRQRGLSPTHAKDVFRFCLRYRAACITHRLHHEEVRRVIQTLMACLGCMPPSDAFSPQAIAEIICEPQMVTHFSNYVVLLQSIGHTKLAIQVKQAATLKLIKRKLNLSLEEATFKQFVTVLGHDRMKVTRKTGSNDIALVMSVLHLIHTSATPDHFERPDSRTYFQHLLTMQSKLNANDSHHVALERVIMAAINTYENHCSAGLMEE